MIDLWYKNAIVYSLDVETFLDTDGDGIGDFAGLASKLDYLSSLHVTCVWLLPFYPSPNRDNGYDVTDFYNVDSRLGTLGDFVEFTRAARERGIRVLADLVVNHTSVDHPWFQAAREDRDSMYRDYYLWSDEKPEDAHDGMVFPGVQESTWTWDERARAWYFHRFYRHQPDLNIANPRVRAEIARIMGFWLQLGVSGFRVDAVPFLIEGVGTREPRRSADEFLREFRGYLSWRQGDAILLAEANVRPEDVPTYVGAGDKIHVMFNFFANQHLFLALATENPIPIRDAYRALPALPPVCQWANFLRTHDELDLGRLGGEPRQAVFDTFAPDPGMRLYERGIRRRLAPMLGNDRQRIELAHSLMLTLPGTPILRYGDEIGMGDDLSLEERQSIRTPMQWTDRANGGFSSAPAGRLIHPVIEDGTFGCARVNVAAQGRDPDSLLSWIQRVIRVRREAPEFGSGSCEFVSARRDGVLAHRLRHEERSVLILHNLSGERRRAVVSLRPGHAARDLLTYEEPETAGGELRLDLPPYGYRWLREEPSARE
ncbi:MAG: alpha-amylase family protein [Vicinamibacterales bacterium]